MESISDQRGVADRVEQIEVQGIRIAYRRRGDGEPLVLLHGGPSNGREWRAQLDGLSDAFTVVAWDMPGTGGSDDPPASFLPRDYAECLAQLLAAIGLDRPHVLGLSFGSGLALELYRWHPEIPRSLILASAYAGWSGSLPPEVAAQRKARMLQLIELSPEEWADEWLKTLLTPAASPEARAELASILAEFHPEGQRHLLTSGWPEHDVRDVLPRIAVPTLLLYGEADVRSPGDVAHALHEQIRASELVFLPGVGHMANVEAPERFNGEVRRFLEELKS